ncbi:MAG TPA: VOC family protein [Nevskiaceae bacterium]|nr:VOC family protein [Nevskiaceae bacterium]
MELTPYLFFNGQCEAAIDFYGKALGAKVALLMRAKDSPEPPPGGIPAGQENMIMHCEVHIGDAKLYGSDGMARGGPSFKGFSLSLTYADRKKADAAFDALAKGGKIDMPLSETFWSPRFGMVTDRFGVQWMIQLPQKSMEKLQRKGAKRKEIA